MGDQNSLDTLIPDSRSLFEAIEGSTETTDISFFGKSFGKLHVDRRVSVTMKEGCLSVQMSKLPSLEDGACDDGADRVHAGNCSEGLVVINVLLLSISLDHKTSF
jgi:hypothetical protein